MTTQSVITRIDDSEVDANIHHFIAHYPPLANDRKSFKIAVKDGVVTVKGHVQSPNTRRYFVDRLPEIEGVTGVKADGLFDEQTIRLDLARLLPVGVQGNVRYGLVILAGELPAGTSAETLIAQVASVPGVERVLTQFEA